MTDNQLKKELAEKLDIMADLYSEFQAIIEDSTIRTLKMYNGLLNGQTMENKLIIHIAGSLAWRILQTLTKNWKEKIK